VFELRAGSNSVTTLASFNGANGEMPYSSLTFDPAGNLYGTTYGGGRYGYGTVFELAAGSNTIINRASFTGAGTNGENPFGNLILSADGDLYGTSFGGTTNQGTIFELANGGNSVSILMSFNGANGAAPGGLLSADSGGNIYGTTRGGGANNDGTVFELAAGSSSATTLASFDVSAGTIGGVITDAAGNLFGTTRVGGAYGDGDVFELAAATTNIATLASFDGTNGDESFANLIADAAGNLYGTTVNGGTNGGGGTIFQLSGSGFVTSIPEPAAGTFFALACVSALWRPRRKIR